jgi:nicotinamidase-related amidase
MDGLVPREEVILVVVDIQEKLFPAIEGKEKVLANSLKVIEFCKRLDIPILVTEQYPKGLGETLPEVKQALGDRYRPISKTAFSCFGEPAFVDALDKQDRPWVVLIGIETHVCVAQTAITGRSTVFDDDIPYDVVVLGDCTGSRTREFHDFGIMRLSAEGAIVSCSDAFFYEILTEAKTDDHKKVFDLLK